MTTLPGGQEHIDPELSRAEDLANTDVAGSLEQDPETVPNADYSDPDTRPAAAPPDGS